MSAPAAISPKSLQPDEQPLVEYQSVSRAAVVALVLGLASAIILATPLLVPVAVAAVITAAIALRAISLSDGQLAGRWAALTGLCLAMLFLGWGFAQHVSRQSTLVGRARQTADVWIDLVQAGKLKEALQFRQPVASRLTTPEALAEHYEKNAEAAQELKGFTTNQGVKDLSSLGQKANVRYEGLTSAVSEGFSDRLVLRYSYDKPGASGVRQPLFMHINRRTNETTKMAEWEIVATDVNPPPGTEKQ
jgi:hypothetical protein